MKIEDKIVTVFGSSRPLQGDEEFKIAYELGRSLALNGFTVCNGGYGGIMEASSRGAKEAGGRTIGVTFENPFKKNPNKWIDREIFEPTLVERMMKLVELGDAYIILKGGTGTLLEFAAVWEFINKGILKEKPILTIGDFWNGVIDTLQKELIREGAGDCARYIHQVLSPDECTAYLKKRLAGN